VQSPSSAAAGSIEWATQTVPEYVQQGAEMMLAGNLDQGIATALLMPASALLFEIGLPLLGLSEITGDITANLNSVADGLAGALTLPILGTLQTWSSTTLGLGTSAQSIFDAVELGDPVAALGALINAPNTVVDAFLNGGLNTPGLLTPSGVLPGPLAGFLVDVPNSIAELIGASSPGSLTDAVQGFATGVAGGVQGLAESLTGGLFDGGDLGLAGFTDAVSGLAGSLFDGFDAGVFTDVFGGLGDLPGMFTDIPALIMSALLGSF